MSQFCVLELYKLGRLDLFDPATQLSAQTLGEQAQLSGQVRQILLQMLN